jgi:hypothetical protein
VTRPHKILIVVSFLALILALVPSIALADSPEVGPFVVALPRYGIIEVAVNGHCLDYGLAFPGSTLNPADMADDEIRLAITYSLANGNYTADLLEQTQWAIWHFTDGLDVSGADKSVANEIVEYAKSGAEPTDLDSGSTSLVDAVAKGWVSVTLDDFENVSDPPYFGKGTLVIMNRIDQTLVLHIPYGVVFKDAVQSGVQDMALFPAELPQADPEMATEAMRETVCHPLAVKLPANETADVLINAHCLDYGLPFPGEQLTAGELVPDVIRNTICYNLDRGYLEKDLWQAQLAVWRQTDDLDMGSEFPLVDEIAAYAESGVEPGDIGADCVALPDAIEQGIVSATLDDFTNISDPPYYGEGTLVVTNLTDSDQLICLPYGTAFVDETQSGVQDMGIFVSMKPDVPEPSDPKIMPVTGGTIATGQYAMIGMLLLGAAFAIGGLVLRVRVAKAGR